jgi:hypothetical protein
MKTINEKFNSMNPDKAHTLLKEELSKREQRYGPCRPEGGFWGGLSPTKIPVGGRTCFIIT